MVAVRVPRERIAELLIGAGRKCAIDRAIGDFLRERHAREHDERLHRMIGG